MFFIKKLYIDPGHFIKGLTQDHLIEDLPGKSKYYFKLKRRKRNEGL